MQVIHAVASQFVAQQDIIDISVLGNGLINDTYLVRCSSHTWVLQRLNRQVFPQPQLILANLQQLSRHLSNKPKSDVKLCLPALLPTLQQQSCYIDSQQECWRALSYIPNSFSKERLSSLADAEQIGWGLGQFHRLCSDLAVDNLSDTLPGFHITPEYYAQYQVALEGAIAVEKDAEYHYCCQLIAAQAEHLSILEAAKQCGELKTRIMHGDPKVNNFLFAQDTQQVISLIDLDTVKPGLIHYDLGDCLRSSCHNEQTHHFELEIGAVILQSYLQQVREFMTAADYEYLYPCMQLIPFELGLRFFTDYLQGNRYFKVSSPKQNLERAVSQFQLFQSIQQQRSQIEALIKTLS